MATKKIWSVYEVGATYEGPLGEVEASSESSALASAGAFFGVPRKKLYALPEAALGGAPAGRHSHATKKGTPRSTATPRGAKSRALAMSPTLIAEKYRPYARSPLWKWWIHLPGSVSTIGEGSTEAEAWRAAADFLSARAPMTEAEAPAGPRSHATIKRASEDIIAQMIGRHVKSGWHGLVDGEILQWEPFGAGTTDVLVRDVASGKLSWYASHGLTPIDGQGPLPSRTEVRKLREAEMAVSLGKIAERWAKQPPRPRIRR